MRGTWNTLREDEIFVRYFKRNITRKEPTLEKFWEDLMAYFHLMRQASHRKQKNEGGTHRDTDIKTVSLARQQGDLISLKN
jgi:hypothetical protein